LSRRLQEEKSADLENRLGLETHLKPLLCTHILNYISYREGPPYPKGNMPVRCLETERWAFIEVHKEVLTTSCDSEWAIGLECTAQHPL
jgi:hypothetical protein